MSGYALSRNHQPPQGLLSQLSNHVAFITNVIAGTAIRENFVLFSPAACVMPWEFPEESKPVV